MKQKQPRMNAHAGLFLFFILFGWNCTQSIKITVYLSVSYQRKMTILSLLRESDYNAVNA
jgi:hypothetical protein